MKNKLKVFAFVGKSGTGKSHRAHIVAKKYGIEYIIDDGILIHKNHVLEGKSAKTEATKIASVKVAIFLNEDRRAAMANKIRELNIDKLLILGTSDDMVNKIAKALELPEIANYSYIQEFATEEEMQLAQKMRIEQGKHVVPVPTFAVKEQFSGYFMDPLKIFTRKKDLDNEVITERTVIRPTYSYLGNYTIADTVIINIIENVGREIDGVFKISRVRVDKYIDGVNLQVDIVIEYGYKMPIVAANLQKRIINKITILTGLNIFKLDLTIKGINLPKN